MNKVKILSSTEQLTLTLVFLALTVILVKYNEVRFFTLGNDTAGFVDLIRAVADNGVMVSPIFSSFYSIIPLLDVSPDTYCSSSLISVHQTSNFLQWHPYFITYLLAIPVKYFGMAPLTIATIINAINISGSLALIYWFLRSRELLVWECLSFILVVVTSQYWIGSLIGQFYFDRLFIFPGLLLVLFCYEKWNNGYRTWLAVSSLAMLGSALISERTVLLASVLTIGCWILSKESRFTKRNITLFFLGLAGLIYLFIYMKFFQNSFYYSGLGWRTILHNLNLAITPDGTLFKPTMIWFGIVLPMVTLSFVNWRYGLLAVAAMLPNLLVTVGGAEKTGFATHYHAGYIPFLIGFAAIGYASLLNKLRLHNLSGKTWLKKSGISVIAPVVVMVCGGATTNWSEVRQVYMTMTPYSTPSESIVKRGKALSSFIASLPANASISSPEWTMPSLTAKGIINVDYMPIGIGSNRYVIANYNSQSNLLEIPSYIDPAGKDQIATCIQNKLSKEYRVKSESMLDSVRYVIYEKLL